MNLRIPNMHRFSERNYFGLVNIPMMKNVHAENILLTFSSSPLTAEGIFKR